MNPKKVQDELNIMALFLVQREGCKEFIAPEHHHSNSRFLIGIPFLTISPEGKFDFNSKERGFPKYFYIPDNIYEQLTKLFLDFQIHKSLHETLTVAFISMFFSRCKSSYSDSFYKKQSKDSKELLEFAKLLNAIIEEKTEITGFTFELRNFTEGFDSNGLKNITPVYLKKFNGSRSVILLEEIIKNYKKKSNEKFLSTVKSTVSNSSKEMTFGSINQLKFQQNYYAGSIYSYLQDYIYAEAWQYDSSSKEFELIVKKLSKFYTTRKRLLFIGKLMILSGLLTVKDVNDNSMIIDNLKKRLKSYLQQDKKHKEMVQQLLKTGVIR